MVADGKSLVKPCGPIHRAERAFAAVTLILVLLGTITGAALFNIGPAAATGFWAYALAAVSLTCVGLAGFFFGWGRVVKRYRQKVCACE